MTNMDIRALRNAGHTAIAWTEGYDGDTHLGNLMMALVPALLILGTATALMLALL